MRCDQASQEIAFPSGRFAADELAAHLDACPACALQMDQSLRLDRLWNDTRIADPTEAAMDLAWAQVALGLDAPEATVIPMPRRRSVGWTRWAIGLASAAAILGPVFVLTRPPVVSPVVLDPQPSALAFALPEVEVGLDETVLIRLDAAGPRVQVLADPSTNPETYPSLADATPHDVMNAMESLAQ